MIIKYYNTIMVKMQEKLQIINCHKKRLGILQDFAGKLAKSWAAEREKMAKKEAVLGFVHIAAEKNANRR